MTTSADSRQLPDWSPSTGCEPLQTVRLVALAPKVVVQSPKTLNAMLQTVQLVGVAALAPEVNAAKNLVRLQPGSDAFKAALATLQQLNGCAPALAIAVRSLGTQCVRA